MPILLVLLLIAAAWHGWNIWKARSAAGTYLMPDGISYVVLKPGFLPSLHAPEGFISTWEFSALSENTTRRIRARLGRNKMVLKQTMTIREDSFTGDVFKFKNTIVLHLERSFKVPGDWDLVAANLQVEGNDEAISVLSINPDTLSSPAPSKQNAIKEFIGRCLSLFRMRTCLTGGLDPAQKPVPSFLHRVPDARLASYSLKRLHETESDSDLEMLRQLSGENSPDMILGLHRMAVEAQKGNLQESQRIWETWNAVYGASAHPLLRSTALRAQRVLGTMQWRHQYPSAAAFWDRMQRNAQGSFNVAGNLEDHLEWLRSVGKCESLNAATERLVPCGLTQSSSVPNYLALQIILKVARVQSMFSLMQGDKQRSLELLAGSCWLGQSLSLCESAGALGKAIGRGYRDIAIKGFELHALEGCETPAELKTAWDTLERLVNLPGQEPGYSSTAWRFAPLVSHMKVSGLMTRNDWRLFAPQRLVDTRFAILRTAVAGRYRFLSTGAFPKSPAEFGPLLPAGPLADCFATSASLKFLQKPDGFHVYSVGPDGQDDKAAIPYDPTNGTKSRGDLALRIPRERQYPFPAGGVRVNTAAELLKMFPKGLPVDPFADKRGRPLNIIASSEADWKSCALPGVKMSPVSTPPAAPGPGEPGYTPAPAPPPAPPSGADAPATPTQVVVFSFGPDVDESDYLSFPRLTGEDMFTTWSVPSTPLQLVFPPPSARLQLVVPSADSASVPPPPPPPPPGLVQGPLGVGRARAAAGMINSPYPGFPFGNPAAGPLMEPCYDPTNGTTSNGNLYLKIPRPDAPGC